MTRSVLGLLVLLSPFSGMRAQHMPCPINIHSDAPASTRALDQLSDTLRHDNNVPQFVFRYPDAFGDDFRNQRFQAPQSCVLTGALFVFPTHDGVQWSTGNPDLVTMVWSMAGDSLPDANQILLRDTLQFADFSTHLFSLDSIWHGNLAQYVIVDLSDRGLPLDSAQWFHLGYTALRNSPDDSLAILSDDGYPETNWASEFFNGSFVLMRNDWHGVNFFIRAIVETPSGTGILPPGPIPASYRLLSAFPNPFNAQTTISYVVPATGQVELGVFDVTGRRTASPLSVIQSPGSYSLSLNAAGWSSGPYWLRLETPSHSSTIKLILAK